MKRLIAAVTISLTSLLVGVSPANAHENRTCSKDWWQTGAWTSYYVGYVSYYVNGVGWYTYRYYDHYIWVTSYQHRLPIFCGISSRKGGW